MTRSTRILSAVHVGANAVLLYLGYYWLGIGESRTSSLLWSAVVALVLVCFSCVLHGATYAYFAGQGSDLRGAFRAALRNLLAILVALGVVLVLYYLLSRWADYSQQPAFNVSSWLTLKFRKPVRPNSVFRIFSAVTWVIGWVVLPAILLPWLASVASRGWAGFRDRIAKTRRYWIQAPLLLVCALWVPFRLIDWVPHVSTFTMEMVSLIVRMLVAYLLFVAAWLVLAFVTSAGKPVLSQPSTAGRL